MTIAQAKIKDTTNFLVIHSENLKVEKHIEYMLGQSLIKFIDKNKQKKKWKHIIRLKDEDEDKN